MLIDDLRREIARNDKPENKLNYQRFFKEKLADPYGIKTAVLRRISNQFYRKIGGNSKKEVFDLCDQILAADERYFRFFAFEWAGKRKDQFNKGDFGRFERWLKNYVDNWGACDHLCGSVIGPLILKFPELTTRTKKWIKSKNRWLRRAAAVCLIVPVSHGVLLEKVFATADLLLTDNDDMVQKGYGWMLKVAGDKYREEVFAYVMKNKLNMPRTALRYAIEKYPDNMRREAMKK
jgi:3-methyladenine DNA glycosylase AlkD